MISFYLKTLEKGTDKAQSKQHNGNRNYCSTIQENRKNNEMKRPFFKNIDFVDIPLTIMTRKKEKTHITETRGQLSLRLVLPVPLD